jgi:hypothetical protein
MHRPNFISGYKLEAGNAYEGERAYTVRQRRGRSHLHMTQPLKAGRPVYRIVRTSLAQHLQPRTETTAFRDRHQAETWGGVLAGEIA